MPALVWAAVPVTADLGQGLSYFRVHSLATDGQQAGALLESSHALVLDLRYTTAAKEDSAALTAALGKRSGPDPLFVLVSPATPPAVSEALWAAPNHGLLLGVKGSVPAPQVIVLQTVDTDRRAYEALENGKDLVDLISGKIEKERYDEASLMKEFREGNTNAEPPAPPDPTAKPDAPEKPAAPAPLIDRVLQRAVHLHRALLALKAKPKA